MPHNNSLLCSFWTTKTPKQKEVYKLYRPYWIHKGVSVSLFLSCTNMNMINSLHQVKEHSKITCSNFLQFESHSSKRFKVRAIFWLLRDLYGNKIQGLRSLVLYFLYSLSKNSSRSPSTMLKLFRNTNFDGVFWMIPVFSP